MSFVLPGTFKMLPRELEGGAMEMLVVAAFYKVRIIATAPG